MGFESFAALEAAVQEAENRWRNGDLPAAFEQYQSILRQRISVNGEDAAIPTLTAADVVIIERTADLAASIGLTEGADSLLAAMVSLNEQAGNRYGADYASLKRVDLALQCGLLRKAYNMLQAMKPSIGDIDAIHFSPSGLEQWESERRWPGTDSADRAVLFSRLYLVMGQMLASLGQYRDSLTALERGQAHSGSAAPDLAQQAALPLSLAMARALLEKGNLEAAGASLASLEQGLDDLRDPGFSVRWLELAGKLDLLRGELGSALERFSRVRDICQRRDLNQAALRATLNLAHVLILLNHTSIAREYLTKAKSTASAIDDTASEHRATYLRNVVQARGQSLADGVPISVSKLRGAGQGSAPRQEEVRHQAPLDIPQPGSYLTFFEDRSLAFRWQLARHDVAMATEHLSWMEEVFGRTDSELIYTRLRAMKGMLVYYQGEFSQAETMLQQARPDLRTLGLKPDLRQLQRILRWCWARLGRPEDEQRLLAQETDELLAEMTESLSSPDRAVFLLNKWTAEEEYIAGEINQLARMKRRIAASPWFLRPWRRWSMMKRIHSLMHYIDRDRDALVEQNVGGRDNGEEVVPIEPLWRRLLGHPRDRMTLSFLVLPDRVLLIRAGWLSLDFGVSPLTRIQVRDLVRRWHKLCGRWSGEGRHLVYGGRRNWSDDHTAEQGRQIASNLTEALQIPALLSNLPERVRALTIVPDDGLHGFPFATLHYEDEYLIERYALSIAFERSRRRPTSTPPNERNALLVGVSEGTDKFDALPGARDELEQVEKWLKARKMSICRLANENEQDSGLPSKTNVLDHLPNSTLLHIACHGVFEHDRPDHSGLVLIVNPEEPEVLSLRELSRVNLSRLKHVTLSSCWSADHFVLPGRWIISLPETLWRAGARSVLGSLWEVHDKVAVAFMKRFYDYLNEYPRDEALRRTQLDCLNEDLDLSNCENLDVTHPVHWAGFNLYGDHRRLSL